jgi:predicted dehydrogenase
MKALVVGSGMYVTGRDGTGHGTVLAALAEYSKRNPVEVFVYSSRALSRKSVEEANQRINGILGTNLKTEFYSSEKIVFAEFLNQHSFDLAIVSVPDHLHFEFCKATLSKGIATLVVKPLTPTSQEATELIRLAGANKAYAAVEFHKRWDESNVQAKATLEQNLLGALSYIDVNYSQRISIPSKVFKPWAEKTNIFQYLGVHYVDLIHFLTGYHPQRVMAHGQMGILKASGIHTYDAVHVSILWKRLDSGHTFYSHFNTNWIDPDCTSAMSDQKIKIVGTLGRIELDQKNRGIELVTTKRGIQHLNPYFAEFLPNQDGSQYFNGYGAKSIMTFLDDVQRLKTGKASLSILQKSRPSFQSALASTAVIEKVNESMAGDSAWLSIDERLWHIN